MGDITLSDGVVVELAEEFTTRYNLGKYGLVDYTHSGVLVNNGGVFDVLNLPAVEPFITKIYPVGTKVEFAVGSLGTPVVVDTSVSNVGITSSTGINYEDSSRADKLIFDSFFL